MEPLTLTVPEACKRHQGVTSGKLRELLRQKLIRGVRVGRAWNIPVSELDRVFLGRRNA